MVVTTRGATKKTLEKVTAKIPDKTLTSIAKYAYEDVLSAIETSRQYRDLLESKDRKSSPIPCLMKKYEAYEAKSAQIADDLNKYESMYEYLINSAVTEEEFEKTLKVRNLIHRTRNWLRLVEEEEDDLVEAMRVADSEMTRETTTMQSKTVEQALKLISVFENALVQERILPAHQGVSRKRGRTAGTSGLNNNRNEDEGRPEKKQKLEASADSKNEPVLNADLLNSRIRTKSDVSSIEIPSTLPPPPKARVFEAIARRPVRTCTDDSLSFKDGGPDWTCIFDEHKDNIKTAFKTLQRSRKDYRNTKSREAKDELNRAIRIARRWRLPVNDKGRITLTADIDPETLSCEEDFEDFREGRKYHRIIRWLGEVQRYVPRQEDSIDESLISIPSIDADDYRKENSSRPLCSDKRADDLCAPVSTSSLSQC